MSRVAFGLVVVAALAGASANRSSAEEGPRPSYLSAAVEQPSLVPTAGVVAAIDRCPSFNLADCSRLLTYRRPYVERFVPSARPWLDRRPQWARPYPRYEPGWQAPYGGYRSGPSYDRWHARPDDRWVDRRYAWPRNRDRWDTRRDTRLESGRWVYFP